ncbi:hypothetical protein C0992_012694 [Termitomyces sp. T32_za158]|nr:hypothetical protein C0992_012694 [Termitomyces sp. T32_za158]
MFSLAYMTQLPWDCSTNTMSTSLEQPNASVNERHTLNSRPSLPRSNSIPSTWPNTASMALLGPRTTLQPPAPPAPPLRKRHSTYILPTPADRAKTPVPVPDHSPIRPLCNPVLGDITATTPLSKKKNGFKGLPSLTTGAQREITQGFQPGSMNNKPSQASPVASDSSSPVSTRLRQFLATGPVSEVTPWEMYPVRRSATSHTSLTSGYVEEVTPWELHPVPSVMPNRSTLATGPLEDVTPWELGPAPPPTELNEKQFSVSRKLTLILFYQVTVFGRCSDPD